MKVVYSEAHLGHRPEVYYVRGRPSAPREVPERGTVLLESAAAAGHEIVAPPRYGAAARAAVHDAAYLEFLEGAHAAWSRLPDASPQIMTSIHPVRHMDGMPDHVIGRAGWFIADTSCPIGPGTWEAACGALDAAVHAAELVLSGERSAYALCRPPGHHCYADLAGGFCYLNNVAAAAQHALGRVGRVAIVDMDVHHGNGTQGIFYERDDVFFASVHGDPAQFYPFFAGYESERGRDAGEGFTMNRPLPLGSGDAPFLGALDDLLTVIAGYGPDLLLVSLGLDASKDDPFAALAVTTDGFRRAGAAVAGLGRPLVIVQEGGYLSPVLGRNLVAFLDGAAG